MDTQDETEAVVAEESLARAKMALERERLAHEGEKLALERERLSSTLAEDKRYYLSPFNVTLISVICLLVGLGAGFVAGGHRARTVAEREHQTPVLLTLGGTNQQEALLLFK